MRYGVILLMIGLAAGRATRCDAQAARVGRLPLLELPRPGFGPCRDVPVTPALQHEGISRLISFQSADSVGHRLVSLGMDAKGASVMLVAMMGTKEAGRGESESVSVFFGTDGGIVRGFRSAVTSGTPARLADDRHAGLLPADTLAARRLATALRQGCRA